MTLAGRFAPIGTPGVGQRIWTSIKDANKGGCPLISLFSEAALELRMQIRPTPELDRISNRLFDDFFEQ